MERPGGISPGKDFLAVGGASPALAARIASIGMHRSISPHAARISSGPALHGPKPPVKGAAQPTGKARGLTRMCPKQQGRILKNYLSAFFQPASRLVPATTFWMACVGW